MKRKFAQSILVLITIILSVQSVSAQDDQLLFRKRILSSTWNSLLYGVAVDIIVEPKSGAAAAGIPIIAAGTGALVPLLTNETRPISTNMLQLTNHGQTIGWVHGFALSTVIFGDSLFASNNNYKVAVGLGAATSIGLGILGRSLGKNKDWSEGQVALYRHYGWVGPMVSTCIAASFVDDSRIFGGTVLLGGAGSYFLADAVNNWNEFSRGDVTSTRALTILTGSLGACILADIQNVEESDIEFKRSEFLIPAAGLIAGTAAGHFWLKDANLSQRQGMTTVYAASGGALLGAGIAMIANSDDFTVNYMIPFATSMGAYAIAVEMLRKKNNAMGFRQDDNASKWEFAFMPFNLMLNSKIEKAGGYLNDGRTVGMQPLFAATVNF